MHANPYMDDDLDDFVVSDGEDIDVSKAVRFVKYSHINVVL